MNSLVIKLHERADEKLNKDLIYPLYFRIANSTTIPYDERKGFQDQLDKMKQALFKAHCNKQREEEINSFMKDVEQTKARLDDLENAIS